MRQIVLSLITIYQQIISTTIKNILGISKMCRYSPTCSEYAKISIGKYGIIKGGYKSLIRLFKCQPFYLIKNNNIKITNPTQIRVKSSKCKVQSCSL